MVLNDISRLIAQELKIKEQQVNATIDLLDSGNTIHLFHVIVKK